LFQDTFCTPSLDIETTCGSFALKGARVQEDATVIKQLLNAGMIVLGKTNPTVRTSLYALNRCLTSDRNGVPIRGR
jgi:Amidase